MSRREIIMLSALGVLICASAYFLFYFQPTMERLDELRVEVEHYRDESMDALIQLSQFSGMQRALYGTWNQEYGMYENSLENDWNTAMAFVLDEFRDTEILRLVQNIVHPLALHGSPVAVDFRQATDLGDLYATPVVLTFTVANQAALDAVINAFYNYPVTNRIVSYSVSSVAGEVGIIMSNLNVSLTVEFVSER